MITKNFFFFGKRKNLPLLKFKKKTNNILKQNNKKK